MSEELFWLEKAKKMVSYRQEALDFIDRAGEQLPVNPTDAPALSRLWVEADQLDEMICSLLDEMNAYLIEGKGDLDTTRGASVRPYASDQESLVYECAWSLFWDDVKAVSVNLAIA